MIYDVKNLKITKDGDTYNIDIAEESPVMTGATPSTAGASGLVPAPAAGDNGKFLKGDGSWDDVPDPQVITGATASTAGTSGLVPAPAAGDQDKVLTGAGTWSSQVSMNTANIAELQQDTNGKADKVSSPTSGNFAGLDSNGNLTDSGSKASDFLTSHQDITGKADKVTGATNGNFATLDGNGNLTDSGHKHSDYLTGKRLTAQTLSAGSTTLTFSDAAITTSSTVEAYADVYGISPTAITVTTGQAVLTFPAQQSAVSVYIVVW